MLSNGDSPCFKSAAIVYRKGDVVYPDGINTNPKEPCGKGINTSRDGGGGVPFTSREFYENTDMAFLQMPLHEGASTIVAAVPHAPSEFCRNLAKYRLSHTNGISVTDIKSFLEALTTRKQLQAVTENVFMEKLTEDERIEFMIITRGAEPLCNNFPKSRVAEIAANIFLRAAENKDIERMSIVLEKIPFYLLLLDKQQRLFPLWQAVATHFPEKISVQDLSYPYDVLNDGMHIFYQSDVIALLKKSRPDIVLKVINDLSNDTLSSLAYYEDFIGCLPSNTVQSIIAKLSHPRYRNSVERYQGLLGSMDVNKAA